MAKKRRRLRAEGLSTPALSAAHRLQTLPDEPKLSRRGREGVPQPLSRQVPEESGREVRDPVYMSTKIRKFRTDKFDT